MTLRAKKPEAQSARFKALVYADKGAGKTHFCCQFPYSYYIDTEGLQDYPHFVNMIKQGNGDLVYLTELHEIIKEVRELLNSTHQYKTLIIDSISFPFGWLSQMEAERLAAKTKDSEGTEYGANLAKAKRLIFQLGILLSRLDMNVLVTAHQKTKYERDGGTFKESGVTFDISDKLAYTLGAVLNLRLIGKFRKLIVEKSRYKELESNEVADFNDGYEFMKSRFDSEIFERQSKQDVLATKDQCEEFKRLVSTIGLDKETIQKWLMNAKAQSPEEMNTNTIEKCIGWMKKKMPSEE